MQSGFEDLKQAWQRKFASILFAWSDTRARYKRSVLGPLWLVLGTGISVLGLGFVWSIILKTDRATFIPSVTLGLVLWYWVSGLIMESTTTFIHNAPTIKNTKTSLFWLTSLLLNKHLINLLHNMLVVLIVFAIYPQTVSFTAFYAFLGFAIM